MAAISTPQGRAPGCAHVKASLSLVCLASALCALACGDPALDASRDPTELHDAAFASEAGPGTGATSEAGQGSTPAGVDAGRSGPSDSGGPPPTRDAGRGDTPAPANDGGARADAGRLDAGGASDAGAAPASDAAAPSVGKKFVGNITTRGQVRSDFAMYWNQITPENEGKWGSVEPTRDQMNWSGLDRVRDYAKQHGVKFKQHTFVWGSQQPSWLSGLSAADQKAEVEEWIRLFCERYPEVELIDVVNEPPPHTTPVYMNALGGAGASGYDWIVQAFKWARQYCPKAILILNDYNTIEYGADNTRFIMIAKAVKAAGAPIDAVGAQAHDAYKLSTATVQQFIDKLASETGLPVYITEYDIGLADDTQQKNVMQSQITMFWNDNNVKGITLWGYVVGATWRDNTGLLNANGTPRPALTWLTEFLKQP